MKSIFTKTLVAAAIASVGAANAATIGTIDANPAVNGVQPQKISEEGFNELGYIMIGDTTTTNDITVTWRAGAAYNTNDTLTFTIVGGTINSTASRNVALVRTSAAAGSNADATLAPLSVDSETGTITFRPSGAQGTNPWQDGDTYELRGVVLEGVGTSVSVSAQGQLLSGQNIDAAPAVTVATKSSQFSLAATTDTLNREIDVENARKQFTGTGDLVTDSVTYALSNSADLLAVSLGTASFTLKGSNLEFLRADNGNLSATSYNILGASPATTGNTVPAINDANTQFAFGTTGAPVGNFGVSLVADGNNRANAAAGQVLAAQTFTADLSYNYGYTHDGTGVRATHGNSTDTVTYADQAAGAWTLSGANIDVSFLPFGTGISHFIYVTNTGSVGGDIEIQGYDESGTMFGPVAVNATAAPNSVTNIGAAVVTALTDAGVNTSTGRIAFTLTVNSPRDNILVTAGYNVRGDRVLVKAAGQTASN